MIGLHCTSLSTWCILLFCFHDAFGKIVAVKRPMQAGDIIEWKGYIPEQNDSSAILIRTPKRTFSLQIIPHQQKIGINNSTFEDVGNGISPGNKFSLKIHVGSETIKIYIGNVWLYTWTESCIRPNLVKSVETTGPVETTRLKRLTFRDLANQLNVKGCGKLRGNRGLDDHLNEICQSGRQLPRVISGKPANPKSHPWQAAIRYKAKENNVTHHCGATLINKWWAISAAHCFKGVSYSKMVVRLGDYFNDDSDKDNNGQFSAYEKVQDIEIETVYKHEDYTPSSARDLKSTEVNDIALIKLKRRAKIGRFVKPVCLPTSPNQYLNGGKCIISGWGNTEPNQETRNQPKCLQEGGVTIKKNWECKEIYGRECINYQSDVMICAQGEGGVISGKGDSGGPLVCKDKHRDVHTLIGITSWSHVPPCDYPAVYTRLSTFIRWMYIKMQLEN